MSINNHEKNLAATPYQRPVPVDLPGQRYSLHSLPSQAEIDHLAQLSLQLHELSPFEQLEVLRDTIEQLQLFKCFKTSPWFFQEEADYLYRPELLLNAPLTKVVQLLKDTLESRHWHNFLRIAHPHYLPQLLARLRQFSSDCSSV